MIEVGQEAPDFTLPDQDGGEVALSGFRGRSVVLYFYPRASTPGCTKQACGVRDHRADYEAKDAVVLGISTDPVKRIKKFAENQGLNFPLLADADHEVAEAYGVWHGTSVLGKGIGAAERTTFIIGPDGRVAEVLRKVNPVKHDELVLAALSA